MTEKFDFIVVGSGSAGGVVAARLSEGGKFKVLCLEAGSKGANYVWTKPPAGSLMMYRNPTVNWCDNSEPNESVGGRSLFIARGKILGGTSAINGLLAIRGQTSDYDSWEQMGCHGWSYEQVLPYFKRIESTSVGSDEFRGRSGPITVTTAAPFSPLQDLLVSAANAAGIPNNADFNGPTQEGISLAQCSINGGFRSATATEYLRPAMKTGNLTILRGAEVTSLLFEGKRCKGVRFHENGKVRTACASREVIVSAGPVGSPKLLELSGVGSPEILEGNGIETVHALPGVGENLIEHFFVPLQYRFNRPGLSMSRKGRGLGLAIEILKYGLARKGLLSRPPLPQLFAFVRTEEQLDQPDAMILIVPYIIELVKGHKRRMSKIDGFSMIAAVMRPETVGSVHVQSVDPKVPAKIDLRFMESEYDQNVALRAVRKAREIVKASPLAEVIQEEILPGGEHTSDEALTARMREIASNGFHMLGTCRMGTDPMAVVDERLRVHGIEGLRIADTSVIPKMISAGPALTAMMIGEKCADMVLADNAA